MILSVKRPIKMVLFDVDGVMTDGTIYMSEKGELVKAFNVKDGLAIELLRTHKILTGVISGKESLALTERCRQLGFDVIETGCKNKLPKLQDICEQFQIEPSEVAFCGDDVLDIPIMRECGLAVAPADAHTLTIASSDWISVCNGGDGFVRDFIDKLLLVQLGQPLERIYEPLLKKISSDDTESMVQ